MKNTALFCALLIASCGEKTADTVQIQPIRKISDAGIRGALEKTETGFFSRNPELAARQKSAQWNALDSAADGFAAQCRSAPGRLDAARMLSRYVLDTPLGIQFDTARYRIENIFPEYVLRNRRGSCLGVSLLVLALAEKAGLPCSGVLVPGHFFVRSGRGDSGLKIDVMKKGEQKSDSWYGERFGAPTNASCYLRNLGTAEVLAVVYYNLGTILYNVKRYPAATAYFEAALAALPDFPEAQGNLAIALAETGKLDSALALARELKSRYPDLTNIDATVGTLLRLKQLHVRQ